MSYLKMVEGFGLVAGLNKSNKIDDYMSGHIIEGEYSCREVVNTYSLFDAYQEAIDQTGNDARRAKRGGYKYDGPGYTPYNDKDIAVAYAEIGDGFYMGTFEEYEAHKKEQERLELEAFAKEFAAAKNVKPGSMAFIAAIMEAIDDVCHDRESWNNYETRAEEYAACMYSGAGSDTYYDDLNYVNGKYHADQEKLYDTLDWLKSECPLLWAKYEESLLSQESD